MTACQTSACTPCRPRKVKAGRRKALAIAAAFGLAAVFGGQQPADANRYGRCGPLPPVGAEDDYICTADGRWIKDYSERRWAAPVPLKINAGG